MYTWIYGPCYSLTSCANNVPYSSFLLWDQNLIQDYVLHLFVMSLISFTLEQLHNFSVFHDTDIFEQFRPVILPLNLGLSVSSW